MAARVDREKILRPGEVAHRLPPRIAGRSRPSPSTAHAAPTCLRAQRAALGNCPESPVLRRPGGRARPCARILVNAYHFSAFPLFQPRPPPPARFAARKNHDRSTRAEFVPCLARSAKYSFTTMIVASAPLTLPKCRSERISRRSSACWTSTKPVFASADFHARNATASVSELIDRVQLYAASAPTAKSCTQPRFTSEADLKTRLITHPAKAVLSAPG